MMTRFRTLVAITMLCAALVSTASTAYAADAQTCQPGLLDQYNGPHQADYVALINALINGNPGAATLIADLAALHDQATYATLLGHATTIAGSIATGRVLITVPDGTVVLDTSKLNNTYANYLAKAINENHNSRVAILAAQEYQCGLGLERKLSTTDATIETYFALRAGSHLDSYGTLRISTKQ